MPEPRAEVTAAECAAMLAAVEPDTWTSVSNAVLIHAGPAMARTIIALEDALRRVERHCPCGARPESLNTHPHVISCPVGEVLGGTVADNYRRAVDG